ncbi:hypothetical protein EN852_006395 [Mesorhizobium sp. M2E.F.Ca.ET.209.01.1.1]|uniref:CbtA family protein n=1 Tax=Mesorhizobium sp. M2E.F.Ca.ET.209.01.1.1 TaxID=2500526 RepID=UPI000FDC4F21|nr:CbtA family protein [Mesorhizobium sp. M2E.F.Ca.ET.209.01.1.1]TGS16836.1 hypothetical protein EN852_006395 [Mesorhizobium sp. M2E.F.Ca.ET.209.01.1.1]
MIERLLVAGMISGLIVAIAGFAFARVFSEPAVERAIVLEDQKPHDNAEEETVNRVTQRNLGLLTGLASYSIALGGILAIGSACLLGRLGIGPRATVWTLASLGYVSLVLVPQFKYPANPPGIGSPETIGSRTELYFLMLALSVASMALSFWVGFRLRRRLGRMFAVTVGVLMFAVLALCLTAAFPEASKVPSDFPSGLLLTFRIQSALLQVIVWGGLATVFGQASLWIVEERSVQSRC